MAPIVPSAGYLQVTKHEGVSLIAMVTKMKYKKMHSPAEKREHVDPLRQERLGDVLPGELMKAVEDVRYVQHDVRVREVKRNRDDRGEQKTCEQNMTSASVELPI